MAASRSSVQARVSRLLSREFGKPILKPNKPLVLANKVASKRLRLGEMSLMMACWKQNEFNDSVCAKEIQDFFHCTAKAEAERKARASQEAFGQSGSLGSKQINKLLKRFPTIQHEI
ncbi:coiled-coil-helix-coiled-coil-helix domain-containing protein 1 isoform X2 [Latimeria chalumnae]|uniref:coiled-coil-helix-coiled-coil-helix domain-containing protein 1 isoform X2 n=1 Tax=Latimeria chalumnae TaxID=7897 RepID=UPI0003C1AA26|nr:PREDICTED: coiled-coil-helix-coiled-coil-helix domain-containing protein 1 isoform X2 [Latimeria chalumnae]|eukprot:XP_006004974.1 PREDICTED: coiled-coil-helix-coiled-coil-helix domain-containing protein 1 isoform X2 [Latimeria chalumnae]